MFYIFLCPHTQNQYLSIQKKKRQWKNTCFQQKSIHLWENWLSFEPKDFQVIINIHRHDQLCSQPHTHLPKKSYLINFMNPRRNENPISSIVPWTSLILELLQSTKSLTSTMFKDRTHISKIMEDELVQILWFHVNHNFNIDLIVEPTFHHQWLGSYEYDHF